MKSIVCFGDSNTWGYNPVDGARFAPELRYTGVLQRLLGEEYRIIEEGLNGRTTALEDPIEPHRNGSAYIECCMLSNMPVDLLIIMLGTNDLKRHLGANPFSISKGLEQLIIKAKKAEYGVMGEPPVLILSPIEVGENIEDVWICEYINKEGREKGKKLAEYYEKIADLHGCYFMDAAKFASPSPIDAIHMDEENHEKLAKAIAAKVIEIMDE